MPDANLNAWWGRHLAEELGGEHRIEDALGAELAELPKQADIEIAAVHDEVLGGEALPERSERQGCHQVHQVNLAGDEELEQAHAGVEVEHVIRFGIHRDLLDAVEGGVERGELVGAINEHEMGRTFTGAGVGSNVVPGGIVLAGRARLAGRTRGAGLARFTRRARGARTLRMGLGGAGRGGL
jgi:hypothetical protein